MKKANFSAAFSALAIDKRVVLPKRLQSKIPGATVAEALILTSDKRYGDSGHAEGQRPRRAKIAGRAGPLMQSPTEPSSEPVDRLGLTEHRQSPVSCCLEEQGVLFPS